MDYYDDSYTKPKPLKKYIADNHLLQTKDIAGATPGYINPIAERREYRNTNYIGDIEGTQADSIKHSITTKRESNPLAPTYQSLDPGEVLQPLIPPLIPHSMIKTPTVPIPRGNKPAAHPPVPAATLAPASDSLPNSAGGFASSSARFDGTTTNNCLLSNQILNLNCFFSLLLSLEHDFDGMSFSVGATKPPSGPVSNKTHSLQLNFGASGLGSSNGGGGGGGDGALSGGRRSYGNSPYNSSRGNAEGTHSSRMAAAAASSLGASGGGGGGGVSFVSPPVTGGRNSGRMTPQERRAALEKSLEINSVKDLR
jgi:hypothetical protein